MNISEFRMNEDGEQSIERLERLRDDTGNCIMNGFLTDSVSSCNFDSNGLLEFTSHKEKDGTSISSVGVVLSDSILIRQTQKGEVSSYYSLYSWDDKDGSYTYLSFDNGDILKEYYERIKRMGISLCNEDVSDAFKAMGLSFENVTQVLLNQKVDPIQRMFDEELETYSKKNSFVL